jgi:Fe-S-cluster containining protein
MLIDIDRPSTWKKYRTGLCDGCFAGCCTMPVEVKIDDLLRLDLITEDEVESPKKVSKKLTKSGVISSYRQGTGLFTLTQIKGRDCYFLGPDRLCTVYDKRPDVCRRFPDIGPRPGFCPGFPHKRK